MKLFFRGLILVLVVVQIATAQKSPIKFGDVSPEELKMTTYPKDSSAAAVILVDFGESYMRYDNEKGFFLIFERTQRIKILKPEGLDLANSRIMTYHQNSNEEEISAIKAITFNLENGKVVQTKMKGDGVFKEKYDKNYDLTTFTLPNVKVGSVLEVTYTIKSDFYFNFQDWTFQSTIPTVWSEYRARIPEYFHYEKYTQGYVPIAINETSTSAGQIFIKEKAHSEGLSHTPGYEAKIDYVENRFRWAAKDIPAFKPEPYLTTVNDYISRINFELSHTKYPQQPVKNYAGNWNDITKMYHESSEFGGEVTGNGFLKKLVEEVTAGMTSPEQKVSALVSYVKSNITWNGTSRDFSNSSLKKVLEEKKGNSAEINLILASMINKTGIEVHPVLLSTRNHGFIREFYPNSTQFNYVICLARIGDSQILLDATEPLLPNSQIPERCLNGKGMVVSSLGAQWVNLTNTQRTKSIATANFTLNADGDLVGDVKLERSGYEGLRQRKVYITKGETDYIKEFGEAKKEWTFSKSTFENIKELTEAFKEKHEVSVSNHVTEAGDILYINPFVLMQKTDNPFKLEKREYPVDFGFSNDEIYMVHLKIPEGYVIDAVPQSKVIALPGNASKYLFSVTVSGNTISLTSNLAINKSLFTQEEYPYIREFYNQVVAKQSEPIVIKKKT